jgi:hypothetical protein
MSHRDDKYEKPREDQSSPEDNARGLQFLGGMTMVTGGIFAAPETGGASLYFVLKGLDEIQAAASGKGTYVYRAGRRAGLSDGQARALDVAAAMPDTAAGLAKGTVNGLRAVARPRSGYVFSAGGAAGKVAKEAAKETGEALAKNPEEAAGGVTNVAKAAVGASTTPLDWKAVVPTKGPYKGQPRDVHVRLHNVDNPAKPQHGVFLGDGVDLTNEAWAKAQALGLKPDAGGNLTVPMGRVVGSEGGQAGAAALAAGGKPAELGSITIHVWPAPQNLVQS